MFNEPQRVARINRQELTDLAAEWSNAEAGNHLRLLLQRKGIDPDRFYQVTYNPLARCWVLTQEGPSSAAAGGVSSSAPG